MTKKQFPSYEEFIEFVEKSLIPPTSEDTLFLTEENITQKDRRNMAYTIYGDWESYIYGYKNAADVLVNHVEHGTGHDLLVYPIMFLYRQYLELAIKSLIIKTVRQQSIKNIHNLKELWKDCEKNLLIVHPELIDEKHTDMEQVARLIKEFCDIDPKSDAFRYPIDTSGNPSLTPKTTQIALTRIRDVIGKIYNVLNAIDSYLSAMHEPGW